MIEAGGGIWGAFIVIEGRNWGEGEYYEWWAEGGGIIGLEGWNYRNVRIEDERRELDSDKR
jgi:hypothetical protein